MMAFCELRNPKGAEGRFDGRNQDLCSDHVKFEVLPQHLGEDYEQLE